MSEIIKLGKDIERANVAAMNRAAKSALTAVSNFIREKYNIKKSVLDENYIIIAKATADSPTVDVLIKSKPLSLKDFKPKQVGKVGRPRKGRKPSGKGGVKVTQQKGKRELIRSADNTRGAFLWRGHVFIRTGEFGAKSQRQKPEKREKIEKLFGPNPKSLFYPEAEPRMPMQVLEDRFYEQYEVRLQHELERRLGAK